MNLYWKESASLFQSAGMSSLVRWMFQINELFLCCLAVQCLVLNFVSADNPKWLHRKNCSKNCFQYLSAKSSLVWLWTQPITRHEAACVKVFWRSTIEAFSFLAALHAREARVGGAPYGHRTPPARPSAPQAHQCSISHFLASLGAQENWYCAFIIAHILHINVVINWQLLKQGIRWPVSPDSIAGSGVDPSSSSIFFKLSFDKLPVLKWSQAQVQFFLIHMKNVVFMCCTIKILISNRPRTRKFRVEKSKAIRALLERLPGAASWMVSLSNYCIWCFFFISNLMKSSVVYAAI